MSFTRQGKLKRRYKYTIVFIVLFLMITTALYYIQESLIFRPTVLNVDYKYEFNHPFEEINIDIEDGVRINGVHFKSKQPKGVILYFHGNMGDISRWGTIAEELVEYNYDVFITDYRTYGKSIGKLSEGALYRDAQSAYDWLKKNFSEDEIIIFGRSLGTGIAANLASKNSPKQLILETPYYSLTDIAQYRFPLIPVKRLIKYKIPTYQYIQDVDCPIYMIHGTEDGVIPYSSAENLYETSKDKNLKFTTIEGGSHNDLATFTEYEKWLDTILN